MGARSVESLVYPCNLQTQNMLRSTLPSVKGVISQMNRRKPISRACVRLWQKKKLVLLVLASNAFLVGNSISWNCWDPPHGFWLRYRGCSWYVKCVEHCLSELIYVLRGFQSARYLIWEEWLSSRGSPSCKAEIRESFFVNFGQYETVASERWWIMSHMCRIR